MRTRFIARLAVFIVMAGVVAGASLSARPKLKSVAGIAPIAWVVNQVGGERVEVSVLLPAGASPETYSPAPQHLVKLSDARILFTVGVPFEERLAERVRDFAKDITISNVANGIGLRHFDDQDDGHGHGTADPHVWLDPIQMYTVVENVVAALTAEDPEGSAYYRSRADSTLSILHGLDIEIKSMLKPFAGRGVYVYHPSFGYFTDRYHLKQIAIEREGKEASAKQLGELIAEAKKNGTHTLFSQPQFSRKQAEIVAREIGATVVIVDPLSESYLGMMRNLAMQVAQSFRTAEVPQ